MILNMNKNLGQESTIWDEWWGGITPLTEIQMWDFYGGRQWITKYVPRYGKVIEVGCGVGRYVFYLKKLGIDIEGVDFSDIVIEKLHQVKNEIEGDAIFMKGDILDLPYNNDSLSGYISLGVVEHFIEGPHKPLAEAYRKMRPGGVAIITTPNKSFQVLYRDYLLKLKKQIKKILRISIPQRPFFQYEYTHSQLRKHILNAGFHVSRAESCDLLYPFCEIGKFNGANLKKGKFAYWLANTFENTWINNFGAQTIVISVKKAPLMHCFLSGKLNATPDSLEKFDVPISKELQDTDLAKMFLKTAKVKYAEPYEISPEILHPEIRTCDYSGFEYLTDPIFENFGFNKNVTPELLKKAEINLDLCVNHIKPIWRNRISNP